MAAATCFHSLTSQGNYLRCQFLKGTPEDKAENRAGFKRNGVGGDVLKHKKVSLSKYWLESQKLNNYIHVTVGSQQ